MAIFRPGRKITDIQDLVYQLEQGRWVYYKERPKAPSFIQHMMFNVVVKGIKAGVFWTAVRPGERF